MSSSRVVRAPYGSLRALEYVSRQSGNCEALAFPILGERKWRAA
jgi:hypothetical protein